MDKITVFTLKISQRSIQKVKEFCKEHGLKIGFFVEKAIEEKIEREELLEDSMDIIKLRHEESAAIPIGEYFEKRRV